MLNINNTIDGYLKNIEIKGNTVQNASDLAEIKSVGDKVEGQDLYEIPLLCTGKNLFNCDDKFSNPDNATIVKISNGFEITRTNTTNYQYIYFDIKLGKGNYYIKCSQNGSSVKFKGVTKDGIFEGYVVNNGVLTLTNNIEKICVYTETINMKTTVTDIQIEEGTQATTYEPYKEDKLTILSPVQIEKVGDVVDRIVEKDGIWGVEKSVSNVVLDGSETWSNIAQSRFIYKTPLKVFPKTSSTTINSKGYPHGYDLQNNKHNSIYCIGATSENDIRIQISVDTIPEGNFTELKKWLSLDNISVKYVVKEPQFIPLPHDQQVILRTFANKTNISFLTEIEGTIKADVPKSLGATVNTHTTQIDGLHQELDRVKKLEESTVSTVTTDKDFVSVQETSNGYFEDVELKGRTLVNLSGLSAINQTTDPSSYQQYLVNEKYIKPNTEYTIMFNSDKADTKVTVQSHINGGMLSLIKSGCTQGLNIIKYTTPSEIDGFRFRVLTGVSVPLNITNIMLLEGDHTQAPPSYFEGLVSVGDGTDEIVVSTVNENLSPILEYVDQVRKNTDTTNVIGKVVCKNIKVSSDSSYVLNRIDKTEASLFFMHNEPLGENVGSHSEVYSTLVPTGKGVQVPVGGVGKGYKYITITTGGAFSNSNAQVGETVVISNIMLNKGTTPKPYTPHKTDKKKLLYLDPTDNTWKKPVLDEFSSVEKGSDGVYRYYKRGEKVVLNGSETWSIGLTQTNTLCFDTSSTIGSSPAGKCICDKFDTSLTGNEDVEHFRLSSALSNARLFINKSKLATQDVAGFKAWLQANNVTVVYQLAQEQVYECTNIDLITYENETNFNVKSGVLSPKTSLKVHNNISNVVSLLQEKVSLLEQNIKEEQSIQNAILLDTDMRVMDIEFLLMDAMQLNLNERGIDMLRGRNEFLLMKERIGSGEYTADYLEKCINKYRQAGRLTDEEYDELYDMIYPPVYDMLPLK